MRMLSILIAVIFLQAVSAYAQVCCPYMSTPTIIPQYPSSTDNIKIVSEFTSPNLGSKLYSNINNIQNSFSITSCYYEGMATQPQTFIDTFVVGQLAIGTYSIMHKAYRSSSTQTCTQAYSNTISTTFYVGTTSLPEFFKNNDVKLYPNPIKDKLIIEPNNKNAEEIKISLSNSLGQLICGNSKKINSKLEIDTSELPAGIYFVKIYGDSQQKVFRVVKE